MTTYTWERTEIEGFEVWYVYINGRLYEVPCASEDEAKYLVEVLKGEELERGRQLTKKPHDDSGLDFTP